MGLLTDFALVASKTKECSNYYTLARTGITKHSYFCYGRCGGYAQIVLQVLEVLVFPGSGGLWLNFNSACQVLPSPTKKKGSLILYWIVQPAIIDN